VNLKDSFEIPAPRQMVWHLLMDAETLRRCIPGCQLLEGNATDGFTATVKLGMGPVKATFTGSVTLTELDAPQSFLLTGSGNGGAAGLAAGTARVTLADTADGTRLTYTAEARISGKLAQLGARLINASVRNLSGHFFGAFAKLATEAGSTA
jgi:hypothetical protein